MNTRIIYGNDRPKEIEVPDNFFVDHPRSNKWMSCHDTEREALAFLSLRAEQGAA